MKTALIIGGTSGLGLELAKKLKTEYQKVIIVGRNDPKEPFLSFIKIDITKFNEPQEYNRFYFDMLPYGSIDLFIYAAGFYQKGTLKKLSGKEIENMITVGLRVPIHILQRILYRRNLPGFIAITSTSQWTPRADEPVYTAVKAGLGMLAKSVSLDSQIEKVLVVAPAGMKTNFWKKTDKDISTMLDPVWVADQILVQYKDNFKYRFIKILREPPRTEITEQNNI